MKNWRILWKRFYQSCTITTKFFLIEPKDSNALHDSAQLVSKLSNYRGNPSFNANGWSHQNQSQMRFATNELSNSISNLKMNSPFFQELILFSKPKLSLYEKIIFPTCFHFRLQIKFKTLEPTGLSQKQW
jgi:hypothetical protein